MGEAKLDTSVARDRARRYGGGRGLRERDMLGERREALAAETGGDYGSRGLTHSRAHSPRASEPLSLETIDHFLWFLLGERNALFRSLFPRPVPPQPPPRHCPQRRARSPHLPPWLSQPTPALVSQQRPTSPTAFRPYPPPHPTQTTLQTESVTLVCSTSVMNMCVSFSSPLLLAADDNPL
jgi:hypothetical protein